MQTNAMLGKSPQPFGKPAQVGFAFSKKVTIKTLMDLKAKLYANANRSMQQNPTKADIIQKRVDADAAHLRFTINMVQVKM